MSRSEAAAAICLVLLLSGCAPPTNMSSTEPIHFQRLPLDPMDPKRTQVGDLTFLGAWRMTSKSPLFGGVSSMAVDGDHFTMLSDSAELIRFTWRGEAFASNPTIVPLPEPPRSPRKRRARDSESLGIDAASGRALVGFEGVNEIRRYSPGFGAWQATVSPAQMKTWPSNGGAESLTVLRDGRVLVLAEVAGKPSPFRRGLLFDHDPTTSPATVVRFRYRPPPQYQPTDAAQLPDGRILVLNRRFSLFPGFRAALSIIDPAQIHPFADVGNGEIAHLTPPLTVDNMEALAVVQEAGRTVVWIASDDNHNLLQRTLLMKFALEPR